MNVRTNSNWTTLANTLPVDLPTDDEHPMTRRKSITSDPRAQPDQIDFQAQREPRPDYFDYWGSINLDVTIEKWMNIEFAKTFLP